MKTSPVTFDDLTNSVLAVPPLARNGDFTLNRAENRRLINHLLSGGIRTLLYGGNANFYHISVGEYAGLMQALIEDCSDDTWIIPSVGPAYGTMMDQAVVLKDFDFPTVMVLPITFPAGPSGIATGIRKFAEAYGGPVLLYIKQDNYLSAGLVASLVNDGLICAIKYAVVRPDPNQDPYLRQILEVVDRRYLVSGIGEQPAIDHLKEFGLSSFTSGCVCVAPTRSMEMLKALQRKDYQNAERLRARFQPLEDERNQHGPIPVLHQAVALAGIADTGPILPLMVNLDKERWPAVRDAARELLEFELGARAATQTASGS